MSRQNVSILRRMYAAFNRGDITTALDCLDPQIEWQITAEAGPSPQTFSGHEGVRSALSSMYEVWADYKNEPLEFIDNDDYVVVRLRSTATGKASGADVSEEVAHVWQFRQGKAVRFEAHPNSQQALSRIQGAA